MRKNYIAPMTENIQLTGGSMMDSLNIATGSGAGTVDNGEAID